MHTLKLVKYMLKANIAFLTWPSDNIALKSLLHFHPLYNNVTTKTSLLQKNIPNTTLVYSFFIKWVERAVKTDLNTSQITNLT